MLALLAVAAAFVREEDGALGSIAVASDSEQSMFPDLCSLTGDRVCHHCIANGGGECWQSYGTTLRLGLMCGLSGGSGLAVRDGPCPEEYGCRLGTPSAARYTLGLGISFWKKGSTTWKGRISESVPCNPLDPPKEEIGRETDRAAELAMESIVSDPAAGPAAVEVVNGGLIRVLEAGVLRSSTLTDA